MGDDNDTKRSGRLGLMMRQLWFLLAVRPYRQYALTEHPAAKRFFAERCPHLAGMIAYFAIFSLIPATFLAFTLLAFTGDPEGQGFLIDQLAYIFPESGLDSLQDVVKGMQGELGSLGIIGILGLIWGMLGFFSATESAFNIIYGVENRVFVKQKIWVLFLVTIALIMLVAAVVLATAVIPLATRAVESELVRFDQSDAAISVLISMLGAYVFFYSVYRFLPNTEVHSRNVWKGAAVATLLFQISIHLLPLYVSSGEGSELSRAFAGLLISLIWFYLMALVMLLGVTLNWWWGHPKDLRREARARSLEAMPRR